MKTTNLYIRSGIICAVTEELPKEPNEKYFSGDQWKENNARAEYQSALQRIKDNAVEFRQEDYDKLYLILRKEYMDGNMCWGLREGEFYPISVEVEIINECECLNHEPKTLPCVLNDKHCKSTKFARIVEEPVEQNKVSEVEKEPEDQEEDIIKLIDSYWKFDDNQKPMSSWHDKQDLLEKLRKI